MRYNTFILSLIASTAVATDPCWELCITIPGACSQEGSFCVDGETCTDLSWMTPTTLCNPTMRGCVDKEAVYCGQAELIVATNNIEGFTAHSSRRSSPLGGAGGALMAQDGDQGFGLSFADEQAPIATQFGPGRKGIHNLGATCYLASALQVVMHSRSIRDAIRADLESGTAPMWHPVYSNFVMLLQQMYDASSIEPLDLSMLLFALHDYNNGMSFENESDDSFQALMVLYDALASVSPRVAEAVQSETRGERLCLACGTPGELAVLRQGYELVRFPGSNPQYRIPEMLRAHFGERMEELGCAGGCIGYTEHYVRPIVTQVPRLLTIGIFRYTAEQEKITTSVDIPLEIDMDGIIEGGADIRYRLVGIIRHMGGHYLLDYLDTDRNEWIHSNDLHIHVIEGRPRNGGADPSIVFYERIETSPDEGI